MSLLPIPTMLNIDFFSLILTQGTTNSLLTSIELP